MNAVMNSFLILATEGAEEASGGFGLNFDIFEANLINLAIVISVLVYFGRNVLSKTLGDRRSAIAEAIESAEERKKTAAVALAEQQQKLAQAQKEAEHIRITAEANAKSVKDAILSQAAVDVERLRETAAKDLEVEQARAIAQLRQQVVALAIQRVEGQLVDRLDAVAQQQLIDRSIAMLGGKA